MALEVSNLAGLDGHPLPLGVFTIELSRIIATPPVATFRR